MGGGAIASRAANRPRSDHSIALPVKCGALGRAVHCSTGCCGCQPRTDVFCRYHLEAVAKPPAASGRGGNAANVWLPTGDAAATVRSALRTWSVRWCLMR